MSTREEFWRIVCSYAPFFYVMFVLVTVMAVMNVFTMVIADQPADAFVVSLVVFVLLGITWLGTGYVLLRCKQHE